MSYLEHTEENLIRLSDYLHEILPNIGKQPMGITTGLPELDRRTRGLKPGEVYIIGGRPSMGKSALMTDMVLAASKDHSVLVFSIEMSATLVIERMLANMGKLNYESMQKDELIPLEKTRLNNAADELFKRNIFICDSAWVEKDFINRVIKSITEKNKLDCVFIDYLQLMGLKQSVDNRNEELSTICRYIKNLARQYNIPFVVLSQLNRGVESRDNRRPRMADLRDSGAIEQDADSIYLLYRPSYYSSLANPNAVDTGETEIIVVKQRNGPTCIVNCLFDSHTMSFRDRGFNDSNDLGDI